MGHVELVLRLDDWFAERLEHLRYRDDTRAYIIGVLSKYRFSNDDLSNRSIVLAYRDAREGGGFAAFQQIGDWVLWASSIHPRYVEVDRTVLESFGRLSYYTCYTMLRHSWPVYEELADELPNIARAVKTHVNCTVMKTSQNVQDHR
jgi:hypothetical protein